jgi:ABC-type Fe3+/spermidine/putrescine transport system ATPase subunit
VREISARYGANRVLDCVSLVAASGEFGNVLDTAGCGKTIVLRAICGFVPVVTDREQSAQATSLA